MLERSINYNHGRPKQFISQRVTPSRAVGDFGRHLLESSNVDDSAQPSMYSVSFRLQRITTEFTDVTFPVSADLMLTQTDGSGQFNVPEMLRRAIKLGQEPGVKWQPEDQRIQTHPIQK